MALNPLTDDRLKTAKELYDDGASVNKIRKETGLAIPTIHKYIGKRDPTPGGGIGNHANRRAKKQPAKSATDEQLTSLFTKAAVAPAIPMGLWLHCDFCANHFVQTGPGAASRLVELSKDHPSLRSTMEAIWRYADEVAWAGLLATWVGVPVAHHLAPDFIYHWLQMLLDLPARGQVPEHEHRQNGNTPEPAPTGFEGMDTATLLHTAQAMGVPIDMSVFEDATSADTPPRPDAPDADDATSAETSTPVTPDTNSSE